MHFTPFLFIASLASANLLIERHGCDADNCARAVTGTVSKPGITQRQADCSSFMQTTVGAGSSTITSTVTATTTLGAAVMRPKAKRDMPAPMVPYYASACSGSVRYSSACSCFGFPLQTVTAGFPITTTTITVTITPGPTTSTARISSLMTSSLTSSSSSSSSLTPSSLTTSGQISSSLTTSSLISSSLTISTSTGSSFTTSSHASSSLTASTSTTSSQITPSLTTSSFSSSSSTVSSSTAASLTTSSFPTSRASTSSLTLTVLSIPACGTYPICDYAHECTTPGADGSDCLCFQRINEQGNGSACISSNDCLSGPCTSDAQCAAGFVCIMTCCNGGAPYCAPYSVCPNNFSPARVFRRVSTGAGGAVKVNGGGKRNGGAVLHSRLG